MWHFPIVSRLEGQGHALRWYALLVPLSLAAAFASHWAIEAPFLRLRRQARPVAAESLPAMETAG
jgi:peptidoglycan/LPS O-acetylase OafA/YrhL